MAAGEGDNVELVVPNAIVKDQPVLVDLGGQTVTLFYLGRGHTDGDLLVGTATTLYAGDLVEQGSHPSFEDSYPGGMGRRPPAPLRAAPPLRIPGSRPRRAVQRPVRQDHGQHHDHRGAAGHPVHPGNPRRRHQGHPDPALRPGAVPLVHQAPAGDAARTTERQNSPAMVRVLTTAPRLALWTKSNEHRSGPAVSPGGNQRCPNPVEDNSATTTDNSEQPELRRRRDLRRADGEDSTARTGTMPVINPRTSPPKPPARASPRAAPPGPRPPKPPTERNAAQRRPVVRRSRNRSACGPGRLRAGFDPADPDDGSTKAFADSETGRPPSSGRALSRRSAVPAAPESAPAVPAQPARSTRSASRAAALACPGSRFHQLPGPVRPRAEAQAGRAASAAPCTR